MCEHCTAFAAGLHGNDAVDRELELRKLEVNLEKYRIDSEERVAMRVQKSEDLATEAELVEAQTTAEVQAEVIDALTPEPEVIESDPVSVVVDTGDGGEAAPEATDLPEPEHQEPTEPKERKSSNGYGADWFFGS